MLIARFARNGAAGQLVIGADGSDLGSVEIPSIIRMLGSTGLDIGRDALSPVVDDYPSPFPFEGRIDRITFSVRSRADAEEIAATARTEMSRE